MNTRQRKIIIAATVLVSLTVLFPPTLHWQGKFATYTSYQLLFDMGVRESIRFDMLLMQIAIIVAPATVGVWLSKKSQ